MSPSLFRRLFFLAYRSLALGAAISLAWLSLARLDSGCQAGSISYFHRDAAYHAKLQARLADGSLIRFSHWEMPFAFIASKESDLDSFEMARAFSSPLLFCGRPGLWNVRALSASGATPRSLRSALSQILFALGHVFFGALLTWRMFQRRRGCLLSAAELSWQDRR